MNKNVIEKMYAGFDKVELSEVSVELALVDDLKATLNSLEDQIFIDDDVFTKTVKISSDLSLLLKSAKERYSLNEKIVQGSFQKIQLAEKYIAQAERVTKELGVDVNTLPNYDKVIKARLKAQDNIKRLSKEQNLLKSLI